MRQRLFFVLLLLSLISIGGAPAAAEVSIELSEDRLVARHTESHPVDPSVSGLLRRGAAEGGGAPTTPFLVLPWVIDDSDPLANATFFSVRNENFGDGDADVSITFYDQSFNPVAADFLTLSGNELVPYNTRAVPGLVSMPGAVNRGLLEIATDGNISADFFQVNFGENFASGDRGLTLLDFCTIWRVRFLRFPGAEGGTVLTFILNGPQGLGEEDPPTISGEVFSESGTFVNSFALQTDLWILELEAHELVVGPTEFGTIVLELSTSFDPSGILFERHSAFSKFSLGVKGVCKDLPL